MKSLFYILPIVFLLNSCNEYQKALKSEDIKTKFDTGVQLYEAGKYDKANRLFIQIVPNYRGKPQAEKLMYLYADTFYQMEEHYTAGYQYERFANAYPKSEKVEEALYKSAKSYSKLSPVYSKDQTETMKALEKLQQFANLYPDSQYLIEINKLVKGMQYKLEKKAYSIAEQYNIISDYKASISAFNNFIIDFPGSSLREKALYYRFDSAYQLGINSVEYKKKQRLEDAKKFFNSFKKSYPKSEFFKEASKNFSNIEKQLQTIAST